MKNIILNFIFRRAQDNPEFIPMKSGFIERVKFLILIPNAWDKQIKMFKSLKHISFNENRRLPALVLNKEQGKIENSQRGFTLVEMIIYMGVLSILLVVLSDIFVSILDTQVESEASSSVEQDGRYILQRLTYDINRAQNVTVPASLGSQNNSLQIVIDGSNNTYSSVSGNLQLTNNNGTNNMNGFDTGISYLTFRRIGNVGGKDTIQINFTLESKAIRNSGRETRSYQTTVGLR